MNTVAICVSYGRRELGELFTLWLKQTAAVPLFVFLDGVDVPVSAPDPITWTRSPKYGARNDSIGALRAASVAAARHTFDLQPTDAVLMLDDDDYYSPTHAERTIAALEASPHGWVGAQRIGYQWRPDQLPPELVTSGGYGPGQHACWGMRLDVYDAAGGYDRDDPIEDVRLADRIGWGKCTQHPYLTHVRRQFPTGTLSAQKSLAGKPYDRDELRRLRPPTPERIEPAWRPELGELEIWCRTNEDPSDV